jgi:TonB-dependent receptor
LKIPCVAAVLGVIFACLTFHDSARAQSERGAIAGRVVDSTGAVLAGARIDLQTYGLSTVTNAQGEFTISNLPPGECTVSIQYVGFGTFSMQVMIRAAQVSRADATLKVANEKEEVEVYAERGHGEAEAINRERTADNILQVLPSEVITSLPNANVADAIGRLPSVTLERDEGEGKYVQIRGTEPRLSNVTIDGINVPSPEGGVRQVKLDTIPADLVESVEINKTLQANMDGDGIGGSVDLKTKTSGDTPTLILESLGGYTPIVNGRYVGQSDATLGRRFGSAKRWGLLVGGSYDYNGRGIDDIEPVPTPDSLTPSYDSMDIREYRYDRSRWGFAGTLDYKLGEFSSVYLRGLYSEFKDYGDRWVYALNNGDVPEYGNSERRPDYGIGSLTLGARHVFSSSWLTWDISVARARQTASTGNPGAKFEFIPGSSNCTYDAAATTNRYLPQWDPACFTEAYNPSNFSLNSFTSELGETAQLNLQAAASFAKNYHLGSHSSTFEIGGKVRNAHKFDDGYENEWDPNGTLLLNQFIGGFHNNNYYDGHYPFGPAANWDKITGFVAANPSAFSLTAGCPYCSDEAFDLVERISAGYLMNTVEFGRFRLVTGVRFEGTQVGTLSYSDVTNTFSVPGGGTYVDVLPSVAIRYRITNDSGIRLVYGRGVSRPDPQSLTSAVSFDNSQNIYSIGNPALKPERANNYDVLYEQYLNPLGMLQAGFFYKDLTDPIIGTLFTPTSGPFVPDRVSQPANAGSAYVMGVEFAYIQHLSFLPGPLRGLGVSANYSYTTSEARGLTGTPTRRALLRQAPNTWNISPTYDRPRLSLRAGLSYNGTSIFDYYDPSGDTANLGPRGPAGDIYLYPHFQVDAQGSYRLWRGLSVLAYGLNMNNEVFGFYNGRPQYVLQREFYKPTYAVGFRYSLSGAR